jgi:Rrf2 family protein
VLGIRRETDYAVRTVLHLASVRDGANVQVREVAAQRRLPLSFVRRIVARLSAAGILDTTRGSGGGIRLARPAGEISMLDVVRAMEGDVALNPCVVAPHSCPLAANCPAQRAWSDATAVLQAHLASVRFDAMARGRGHAAAHRRLARAGLQIGAVGQGVPQGGPATRRNRTPR